MLGRNNKKNNIGTDIVEVGRFSSFHTIRAIDHAVKKIFSAYEIRYCLDRKDSAVHFAGIFAAKEAASKALGTEKFPLIGLEIRHAKNGSPEVWMKGKKLPVEISITHTRSIALAVALS